MTPTEIALLNVASLFIGFLIGNYLAIGRDRRREFNALIDPIRAKLFFERKYPGTDSGLIVGFTFVAIRERLLFWKRKGFDIAIDNYKKSKGVDNQERDTMGGFSYKDRAIIVHAIDDLMKYLKPR